MSKDNIELPPLPEPFTYVFPNVERNQLFHTKHMQDYAREAIKADRQQRGEPDVAALVEALTELCDEIDKHEIHAAISETSISWFKRKARALLARYVQTTEPEGWQLVPKEPTSEQICHIAMRVSGADEDGVYRTDKGDWFECVEKAKQAYQQALETAPKFGEEE